MKLVNTLPAGINSVNHKSTQRLKGEEGGRETSCLDDDDARDLTMSETTAHSVVSGVGGSCTGNPDPETF